MLVGYGTSFLGLRSSGPIAVSTSIISRFDLRLDNGFSEDCPPIAGSAKAVPSSQSGARSQPLERHHFVVNRNRTL